MDLNNAKKQAFVRTNVFENASVCLDKPIGEWATKETQVYLNKARVNDRDKLFLRIISKNREMLDAFAKLYEDRAQRHDGLFTPLAFAKTNETIEILYDEVEDNLEETKDPSYRKIILAMKQILKPLVFFEKLKLFPLDLKPECISYKCKKAKLLLLMCPLAFQKDLAAAGQESSNKEHSTRLRQEGRQGIGTHAWGLTFLKLLTRSAHKIGNNHTNKMTGGSKDDLRAQIESLELDEYEDGLIAWTKGALRKALDETPTKRVTFRELDDLPFSMPIKKGEKIKELLNEIIKLQKEKAALTGQSTPQQTVAKSGYIKRLDEQVRMSSRITKELTSVDQELESIHKTSEDKILRILKNENTPRLLIEAKSALTDDAYVKVKAARNEILDTERIRIDLCNVCIGDQGTKLLTSALLRSKSIVYLQLGFCKIGLEGAKALGMLLRTHCSIRGLFLGQHVSPSDFDSSPSMGNRNTFNEAAVVEIAEGMKEAPMLEEIDLCFIVGDG